MSHVVILSNYTSYSEWSLPLRLRLPRIICTDIAGFTKVIPSMKIVRKLKIHKSKIIFPLLCIKKFPNGSRPQKNLPIFF
jgi:hypothetical protein